MTRVKRYSEGELAWVEANKTLPRKELHRAFCERFNRDDVSFKNLEQLCLRKRWLTGRHNGERTGNRIGRGLEKYKPIGAERVYGGYVQRKVNDEMPLHARWKQAHILNWQEMYGPISAGHCLKCLSGDKLNTDPSNWALVPRAMLPRLNGASGRDFENAPAELKPVIMKIAQLEMLAQKRRQGFG